MATIPITEPEARSLADAILQVSASQPPSEAAQMVNMALQRAPDQPIVLNAAGGHFMRVADPRRARELFQKAIAADPKSKVLWLNLAGACRALGDASAEIAAIDQALALEPRYVAALLQKGELMERNGQAKAAFFYFEAALDSIATGAPASAQSSRLIEHARDVVRANRTEFERFLEERSAGLRTQHASADFSRYDACRDIYLRKRQVFHSQPKQILFPFLSEYEFFPRALFPWLEVLEAATDDIAAEALAALGADPGAFRPYVDFPPGTPVDQWAALNHSTKWSVYRLWHDGKSSEPHLRDCPKTAGVLEKLPLCDVPGYGPGAFFSVLQPYTRLPPHTGTTNTRSIVHLPLVVPEKCGFRVGAEVRSWQRGRAWVFDDSMEHEAWNDSGQVRIILIFDVWNPLLSAAERDLVREMTQGIGHFYGKEAPELGVR